MFPVCAVAVCVAVKTWPVGGESGKRCTKQGKGWLGGCVVCYLQVICLVWIWTTVGFQEYYCCAPVPSVHDGLVCIVTFLAFCCCTIIYGQLTQANQPNRALWSNSMFIRSFCSMQEIVLYIYQVSALCHLVNMMP